MFVYQRCLFCFTSAIMVSISSVSRFIMATLKYFSDKSRSLVPILVVSVACFCLDVWLYFPISSHILELTENYILIMY